MRITLNDLPTSMTKKMADRTTFDSAMPLSYIASHYPDVRNAKAELVTLAPGLRPERRFAPLARGS